MNSSVLHTDTYKTWIKPWAVLNNNGILFRHNLNNVFKHAKKMNKLMLLK
ncbi:hypothetical protein FACS189472_13790 [Alphaproteobacteria bacterium]|nr:hypothetical protein FACS189472_13790 [Alphaproteobacteria bacterium]